MSHHSDEDKRNALLQAARELFLKNTYSNISIRRIAKKAGVNSALIAYYFDSKGGLFREMIKSYITENLNLLRQSVNYVDRMALRDFMKQFYRTMPPEMIHLTIRTLLFERGELRDWLIESLLNPIFGTGTVVSATIVDHSGKAIDPQVLRTSIQSMLVFPKLIQPILEMMTPDEVNTEYYDRLAEFQADMIGQYFGLEEN
jgi:AcrR family transcriptional regulator